MDNGNTDFPIFIVDTLGYTLGKSGFIGAAPYLAMAILLAISGYLADMCQTKGYLTTTQVRRYFNCGGQFELNKIKFKLKRFSQVFELNNFVKSENWFLFAGFLAQTVFLMSAAYLMTPFGTISCIIVAIGLGAFAWCGFS